MEDLGEILVGCACGSPEHILRFTWIPELDELCTEVQLIQWRNPLQRIWVAIKYVFGYKCSNGQWDCTIMNQQEAAKLYKFVGEKLKHKTKKEKC